jgi:hypothetical protein
LKKQENGRRRRRRRRREEGGRKEEMEDDEEDERVDRDGASVPIISYALLAAGQHEEVFPSSFEHQFQFQFQEHKHQQHKSGATSVGRRPRKNNI